MTASVPEATGVSGRVSIIMPTLNSEQFLDAALESIVRQSLDDVELVIHDGGSTDSTLEIVDSYRSLLDIRISSGADSGQSNALNRALAVATGEYVGWLNGDDEYVDGSLRALLLALERDKTKAVAYGHHEHILSDGTTIAWVPALPPWAWIMQQEGFVFNVQSALWRRKVHDYCGWFDEGLHRTMDFDFMVRMLLILGSRRFVRLDATVGRFRRHENQKTDGAPSQVVADEHAYIERKLGFRSARSVKLLKPLRFGGRVVRAFTYLRVGGLRFALRSAMSRFG